MLARLVGLEASPEKDMHTIGILALRLGSAGRGLCRGLARQRAG
jgi:hypothetical protein